MRNLSAFRALLLVLLCGLLSSWGALTRGLPALTSSACQAAEKYDSLFPEIVIHNGKLSAKESRSLALDSLGAPNAILVIDTGEKGLEARLNSLNGFSHGAVITGDAAIVKIGLQIRILPLPALPDMALNSNFLAGFVREQVPHLTKPLTVLMVVCCLGLALLQASFLTLMAYLAGRAFSLPLDWRESWRIASIALIPPVALEFLIAISASKLPMGLVARLLLSTLSLAFGVIYWSKFCISCPASLK